MTKTKGVWLNLGCGDDYQKGFINVDLACDLTRDDYQQMDLRDDWACEENSVDYILAKDIIEHLPDKIHTMNEAYRVLKPGGIFEIHVPTTEGAGAFQDPTHVSFWNRQSFWYFEDGNIYRERFASSYQVFARFKVVSENMRVTSDGPYLTIILEAVKNHDDEHSRAVGSDRESAQGSEDMARVC